MAENEEKNPQPENAESEEHYHNPDALFRVASWANILAWIVLVLSALMVAISLFLTLQSSQGFGAGIVGVYSVIVSLVPFLFGAFFFVVLEALSESLYVLMDIEENTRATKK